MQRLIALGLGLVALVAVFVILKPSGTLTIAFGDATATAVPIPTVEPTDSLLPALTSNDILPSAPTPTITPTSEPTETPTPDAQKLNVEYAATVAAMTPRPISTISPPTPTQLPQDIILDKSLTEEEKRMERDGLQQLKNCAPQLYNYVRSHVRLITRGNGPGAKDAIAYVLRGGDTLYLPAGTLLADNQYNDSERTFLTAANLVHEANHIALGLDATESEAYRMELQVYVPACYPNDMQPSVFEWMRRGIEARAR